MYNPSRGSSSSSHSDTQRSSSSDYYHKRGSGGGGGGDRYSNEQDYTSSASKEGVTTTRTRRNRWDDKDSGGDGYGRQRDRSRSPVKHSSYSSSNRDQRRRLIGDNRSSNSSGNGDRLGNSYPSNYNKKASNNWSDSSSDEEDRRYHRKGNAEDSTPKHESLPLREEKLDLNSNGSYYGDGNSYHQQRQLELDAIQQQELIQPQPVTPVEPFRTRLYNPCTPLEGTAVPRPSNGRSSTGVNSNDLGKQSGFTALSTAPTLNRGVPPIVASFTKPAAGIQMKLAPQMKPAPVAAPLLLKPKSAKLASVFNVDDDDEEEEMPAECKMRMKNVGRETPTSAGPNSFGKTKMGFCNMNQIKERKLQEELLKKK